jgi:VanZ family protein
MKISSREWSVGWGALTVAILVNAAGYILDLYDRFWWFDDAVHAYTSFTLSLLLALLLYGRVLDGARTHSVLFVLAVAVLGGGIGALWEIAEWGYDQWVPENAILGKTDTIIDLILDTIGSLAAGLVSLWMIRSSAKKS